MLPTLLKPFSKPLMVENGRPTGFLPVTRSQSLSGAAWPTMKLARLPTRQACRATSYKLQAASYELQATRYMLQVTSHNLQVTSCHEMPLVGLRHPLLRIRGDLRGAHVDHRDLAVHVQLKLNLGVLRLRDHPRELACGRLRVS